MQRASAGRRRQGRSCKGMGALPGEGHGEGCSARTHKGEGSWRPRSPPAGTCRAGAVQHRNLLNQSIIQ